MSDRPTRLPAILTAPMSWIYGLGASYNARRFDRGHSVVRLDRPVISIGNLSAGGTGKTPMVHHVVRALLDAGHRPVIAMRGYKAEPGTLGDEAMEHRSMFADIPMVVQPDRVAGLRALFETEEGRGVDCVVLDDGFQHRRIARDLDVVLIDASRPPDGDALLPRGYLREPISALKRADALVFTHAEMVEQAETARIGQWMKAHGLRAPVACTTHDWDGFQIHDSDGTRDESSEWISSKRVLVVCAIGNPNALRSAVLRVGGKEVGFLEYQDHAVFVAQKIEEIVDLARSTGAQAVLMTQKDWVKAGDALRGLAIPVAIPRLRLGFQRGESAFGERILGVFSRGGD